MTKSIAVLLDEYGSDKNTAHSYGELYEQLFKRQRLDVQNVLEIGVYRGASIAAWAEYFTNATVYGIDINPVAESIHTRARVLTGDAADAAVIAANFFGVKFDIIIDDGSHIYDEQRKSFEFLLPYLKTGGYYIIEDIVEYDRLCADDEFNRHFCVFDRRRLKNDPFDILLIHKKP